ncbi:MAG: TIGR03986 family CRISPR-associated RAMP protein [Polyangiaceae bacterium]|nr:TIGR03986 family CRISPR-associated RAMP protein [Polyangiaceae bacterium]
MTLANAPGGGHGATKAFFHMSNNGNVLPSEQAAGKFQVEEGPKGLRVLAVRWDAVNEFDGDTPALPVDTFVHPYNFVSVPAEGLGRAATVPPFKREPPATHERYDAERHSGWLQCSLTTDGWWFLPDARKVSAHQEHKVLGYFTLDPFDEESWKSASEEPSEDKTAPAIPASSLRGMIRSVFEAATLSCFSVFDGGRLDLRVGFDPGYTPVGTRVPGGRQSSTYVPARVLERTDDGKCRIQLLNGRTSNDPPKTLPVALVHAYDPRVKRHETVGSETDVWRRLAALPGGSPVAAVVSLRPVEKRKNNKVAYHYCEALDVRRVDKASELQLDKGQTLVFGYLHRTGPNIENKHHERIFFKAGASYNNPKSTETLAKRVSDFRADELPDTWVDADVVRAADESLQGYQDRHEKALRDAGPVPRRINEKAPHISDFVGSARVREGQLCYALMEGAAVRGLYPVALPRLAHDDSRADLLHDHFHPCNPADMGLHLCPACRVFGWVRPGGQKLARAGRVDATASHIRMTHGVLQGTWGSGAHRARLATLAILASPKPTTTAFYLRPSSEYEDAQTKRWPPVLQTALHKAIPLYRRDEASLRGRKFYRRRVIDPGRHVPANGGILRPADVDGRPLRDSQNRTVHLLPPQLKFGFRVHFDNLTGAELGALVFAITLQQPDARRKTQGPTELRHALGYGKQDQSLKADEALPTELRHALGYGKPLGLGACSVEIDTYQLDVLGVGDTKNRYAQVPTFEPETGVSDSEALLKCLSTFWESVAKAEKQAPDLSSVRESLIDMVSIVPPEVPVNYPPGRHWEVTKHYEWFVQNRRGKGALLPEPVQEREDKGRLPRDPREG